MGKFRKGDVCTIEVVVDSNLFGDGDMRVRQRDTYTDIYVKQSALTMVRPTFEVGDRVAWQEGSVSWAGRVLSIANDHLWVDDGDGNFATVWVAKATRVEAEPEATSEAA